MQKNITIKGKVIQGNKKAAKMGFPTANIRLEEPVIEPGIYAAKTVVNGETYKSAVYVANANPYIVESHIMGFEGDLYDKEIQVTLFDKVRDDFYISDEEKLKEMIENDIQLIHVELDKVI